MILVTGATGKTGGALVEELRARGVPVQAMVRTHAQVAGFRARGVEAIVADYDDPRSLPAAVRGVDKLYLLTAPSIHQADHQIALIDVAKTAGVQYIVKHSGGGAAKGSASPFMAQHGQVEDYLVASGIPHTILRPSLFMQNFDVFYGPSIAGTGMFYTSVGDTPVSFVDARDIAAVAAHVLLEDVHQGQVYEVTGGEALSHGDVASQLSTLLGKRVQHIPIPDETQRQGLLDAHLGDWFANSMVALNRFYREGGGATVADTVQRLTGRAPRTMHDYLCENLAAFGG